MTGYKCIGYQANEKSPMVFTASKLPSILLNMKSLPVSLAE